MNILHLLLVIGLLYGNAAHADFQTGVDAVVRRDFDTALQVFKPLAEQGNVAAQVNLGNLYMKGWGVEQNYHLAQHWYLKAANQGERMAQTKLGILYYYGLGIDKDLTEAMRWFQKAAEGGETSAQAILGSMYASGDGVPKNLVQAFYWYTMAEEQGNLEAAKGRKSLEDEITPGQRDEALRLMSETRKRRGEQEEKAFEAATAGLGPAQQPKAGEPAPTVAGQANSKTRKPKLNQSQAKGKAEQSVPTKPTDKTGGNAKANP